MQVVKKLIAESYMGQGRLQFGGKQLSNQDLVELCLYPVVNECCRVIDEGHVVRESDVDMCSITVISRERKKTGFRG